MDAGDDRCPMSEADRADGDPESGDGSGDGDGPHSRERIAPSWVNCAGMSTDEKDDSVTVSISVGDPRGAFTFTVRRIPDNAESDLPGRLILHVPYPGRTGAARVAHRAPPRHLPHWLSPPTDRTPRREYDHDQRRQVAPADAGQLRLTGTDSRHRVDLLGVVLTTLRSDSARKGCGQFTTPGDVADFMAEMLGVTDSDTVHEPAAGTGGMLRAVAQGDAVSRT